MAKSCADKDIVKLDGHLRAASGGTITIKWLRKFYRAYKRATDAAYAAYRRE
jgi:hypothetical protein